MKNNFFSIYQRKKWNSFSRATQNAWNLVFK